jgi:predicted TIM-barrel fold metal-dependent hydrolase
MRIDAHCHAGRGDGLTGAWDTRAPLGAYLHRARACGISRSIVFSVFHGDYAVANREVARIVAAQPDRLVGFAFVHPTRDRRRIPALVGEALRWGFRGIKAHRHDAPLTREVCEVARRHRLPVLYDPMGELPAVAQVAAEYADVPLVLAHFGSYADDGWIHHGVIDLMCRFPNVHADTSGVRSVDTIAEAVRRVGHDRIIFGSDGPFLHPALELAKVKLLGLPPPAERAVLGGNIARLMGWHDPVVSRPGASPRIGQARPRSTGTSFKV